MKKIVAYVDLRYTLRQPTGVDKHIARMLHGLRATPGCDVSVLASRDQLPESGNIPAGSSLASFPCRRLPLSNREARMLWAVSPWPAADRFCPAADWLYSPQELWCPATRMRTATTVHGVTYFEPALPGYNRPWAIFERARADWFYRQICRRADRVLSVSRYVERFLMERFGLPEHRSVVVGNGVDACFFAAGCRPPVPCDEDRVLVVGGLNDWDGARYVLDVARALLAVRSPLQIDIAGTFDDARYVRQADALLYLPAIESFGMVALEAMAAGLPVVACRLTAVPETAADAAAYVDASQAGEIVDALQHLRRDSASRQSWIAKGRSRAEAFTWDACVNRLAATLLA
jgi:glycosyltransferase involved in cell wall biosynthesis